MSTPRTEHSADVVTRVGLRLVLAAAVIALSLRIARSLSLIDEKSRADVEVGPALTRLADKFAPDDRYGVGFTTVTLSFR